MPIDLEKRLRNHMKKVSDYITENVGIYFSSQCRIKLANRIKRLDDSIDMRWHTHHSNIRAVNAWKTKIAMPLVREKFLFRRAATFANFKDPVIAVSPVDDTPTSNAINVQDSLTNNFRRTKFRQKCFRRVVNTAARYGSSVVYSAFQQRQTKFTRTVMGPFGPQKAIVVRPRMNVVNRDIHPLNYFQDPTTPDPDDAGYKGYIERIRLSQLVAEVKQQPDAFLEDQVKAVVAQAKKNVMDSRHYYDNTNASPRAHNIGVDRIHWYGTINIDGNEDDDTVYYVQMIGDKIIRLERNPNDQDMVPLSQFHYEKRLNFWWGNVDVENVLPHENFMQLIMSVASDEAIRKLERMILYPEGVIDPADLNNRHKLGGFVPYRQDGVRSTRELFTEFQGSNSNAINGLQALMQEMKESAQRVSTKGDLFRQGVQGGIPNETATGAMILDEQGDILEADLLENFAYGLTDLARVNTILMQMYMPDQFQVQSSTGTRTVSLEGILGMYEYKYDTSLTKNKQIQAQNLLNWITFIQNMRGTGDPTWLNVDMQKIVRQLFRKIDLGVNVDEVYPDMPEGVQNPMIPGMGNNTATQLPPVSPSQAAPSPDMGQPTQQEVAVA